MTQTVEPRPITDRARPDVDLAVLEEVQRRVLWLSTRIVDSANRERPHTDGVKVGGHQASSASMVSAMTALYFSHLDAADRVSVKPHASPVFHAIQYLLGNLDRSYLTRLRDRGGLQSYPSRTKDPDEVDFSTGSVGLGAAAPLFAAAVRRYVDAHFGERPRSRFVALLGDAELDEGNIWEAVADSATAGLGNVMWVVDFNRQSLDRVVPGIRIDQWRSAFEAAGWHVLEVKYGRRLQQFFARPGGDALRRWIDAMPNEQYQSLFGLTGPALRERFLDGAPDDVAPARGRRAGRRPRGARHRPRRPRPRRAARGVHRLRRRDHAAERRLRLHRQGLGPAHRRQPAQPLGAAHRRAGRRAAQPRWAWTTATEWDQLDPASPAGQWAGRRAQQLRRPPRSASLDVAVPDATGVRATKPVSTQEVFGRVLVDLSRDAAVAPYLVTTAPDVATSTNLAGFINRTGVFAPEQVRSWNEDPLLKWAQGPTGQHIELGISEMNLFLLLGQLGLSWDLSDQPLLPIGTVYDPFVCRGLDAFIYGTYSGARFLVAGTPSGITLAPEGGAHQSTITASIGVELPGVTFIEPAYATALDWLMCHAVGRMAAGSAPTTSAAPVDDGAYYLRLSTRPIEQAPFEAARRRLGDAVLRRQVLAGAYRLLDAHASTPSSPSRVRPWCSSSRPVPVLPEVLQASAELADEGVAAHVVDVTSLGRLYSAWQRTLRQGVRTATAPSLPGALRTAFGTERTPLVTVHDAASHAMSWLGSALGVPCVPLGVDEFGQSGDVGQLYELHDLTPGSVVNAALAALSLA